MSISSSELYVGIVSFIMIELSTILFLLQIIFAFGDYTNFGGDDCGGFLYDGNFYTHYKFKDPGVPIELLVNTAIDANCQLRVLAVGGGGRGYSGGGGYIQV